MVVPEVEFDFERDIVQRIRKSQALGKNHFIILVSEGVFFDVPSNKNYKYVKEHGIDSAAAFAAKVQQMTGVEAREAILGHVQRGGSPTARDRIIATEMGNYAVGLLKNGISNRVVVMKDNKITDYDILEALQMKKPFDRERFNMANAINI